MHYKKKKITVPVSVKKTMVYNVLTQRYDITEGTVTYHLDMGQMNAFKAHLRDFNKTGDVTTWYESLPKDERKLIQVTKPEQPEEKYNDGNFLE